MELHSNNQSSVLPLDILVQPRVPCKDSYADVQTLRDFLHVSAHIYHISVECIICKKELMRPDGERSRYSLLIAVKALNKKS